MCLISVAADIAWLLQGLEEFGKVVGRNVIFKIINIKDTAVFVIWLVSVRIL